MGERLTYQPWQLRAARSRLLGGGLAILLLLWLALAGGGFLSLLALGGAALGGLYLLRTAWEPLRRRNLVVELVAEGARVNGVLYPKEAFQGVEGPRGSWTWLEKRPNSLQPYKLHLAPPGKRAPSSASASGKRAFPSP